LHKGLLCDNIYTVRDKGVRGLELSIKEISNNLETSLIKAETVPDEIQEIIEGMVMGYVMCYETIKYLDKKEVS